MAMDGKELREGEPRGGLATGQQGEGMEPHPFLRVWFGSHLLVELLGVFRDRGEGFIHPLYLPA